MSSLPAPGRASPDPAPPGSMQALNRGCFCTGTDERALAEALTGEAAPAGLDALLRERCPTLFAARPVFIAPLQLARVHAVVAAVESVVRLPAWHEAVLGRAPASARHDPGARGVFLGFDFHVRHDALGLIEINTNAGGAMVNAVLARAQRACCAEVAALLPAVADADGLERRIVAMFRREWALGGIARPLRRIAIVDAEPEGQYLYPEFLLFQRLFQRHGIEAVIADPKALVFDGRALRVEGEPIDLVYNRLTDFALEDEADAALRAAHLAGAALVTPHPRAHALYADKRNLALLSDDTALRALCVPGPTRELLLEAVPLTQVVDSGNAEALWRTRRQQFFKPFAGYGSRAAYRGDKLTQRVWQEIVAGGYVAQALVAPGERSISAEPGASPLKFDLRAYAYEGAVMWTAARLYQGQTTNFRTPGGGFAPVYPSVA